MKTKADKLYSGVFWIFLPNVIKIDPYNLEIFRFNFKVGAFLDTVYTPTDRTTCVKFSWLTDHNN